MTGRIEKPELVKLVSERTSQEAQTVDGVVDAFLDEIYQALKRGDSVSLRASAPSTCGQTTRVGCSGSTRRSACVRCSAGRPPTVASSRACTQSDQMGGPEFAPQSA